MATLPTKFRQAKRDPENRRATLPSYRKLDKVSPRRLNSPTQYHAYFIQGGSDSKWTNGIIDLLENTYGYECAEYDRDFLIGERILDLMSTFIFTSDRIVMVLSENFLNSKRAMHQLHLAVHYDIDHGTNNIVALHIDECEVPSELLPFECIDATVEGWEEKFMRYLSNPAPKMLKEICTKGGTHVSVDEICKTQRSVMSDPPTLNPSRNILAIPDHIRQKIKIWHRSKSMDETQHSKQSPAKCDTCQTEETHDEQGTDSRSVEYSIDEISTLQATLMHALKMRIQGKRVFEASQTRIGNLGDEELKVNAGDVLEILHDVPHRGNMYECENAQGKVGLVPRGILVPSWHLLPSNIVKLIQQPITSSENDNFKGELVRLGLSYYIASNKVEKTRYNTMHISVQKGDILLKLSVIKAGRAEFKNCRNERGYLAMENVTHVAVEPLSTTDRWSNTSIGSEGYGSDTGENACSNV